MPAPASSSTISTARGRGSGGLCCPRSAPSSPQCLRCRRLRGAPTVIHPLAAKNEISRKVDITAGQEEATTCMILEEIALKVHELVGVRMHCLAVCEWEVKLWLDSVGPASGAWRFVVTNVTGHTCTVHMDIRGALGDLFSRQLMLLLP